MSTDRVLPDRPQPLLGPAEQVGVKVTVAPNLPDSAAPVMTVPSEIPREEIARRAYLRAEQRGFLPGHECEDWLAAETDLVDFWFTEQRHKASC